MKLKNKTTFIFRLDEIRALVAWTQRDPEKQQEWMAHVHFDAKVARVWVTDGHRALVAATTVEGRPSGKETEDRTLYSIRHTELRRALKGHRKSDTTMVEIRFAKKKSATVVIIERDKTTEVEVEVRREKTTYGQNIDRIFPTIENTEPSNGVAMRPTYLAALGDLDFCSYLQIYADGELDPVAFSGTLQGVIPTSDPETYWDALIMPIRV